MANPKNINVLYELQGESLKAAKQLLIIVGKAVRENKPQDTGLVSDIQKSWSQFYQNLFGQLNNDHPQILQATGLLSPATTVKQGHDTLPRAYNDYPQIYVSSETKLRFFMYCPIDYKGNHFVPEGGRLLEGQEEQNIGTLLFAGGWLDNAPLFHQEKYGVAVPADYKKAPRGKVTDEFERVRLQNTHACYIAAGRSLQIIEEIEGFDQRFSQKCNKALAQIKAAVRKQFPDLLKDIPQGEKLYINSSYGYGGHHGRGVEFSISVRKSGKVNIMDAGQPVEIKDSPYFTTTKNYGEYVIAPRTDTKEGRKIAAAIAAIPQKTFIHDYDELRADFTPISDQISQMLGTDQPFPRSHRLEGFPFLVYGSKVRGKNKITFCPPDAIPVSTKLYEWLKADEADTNMGIALPPRPQSVLDELAKLQARLSALPAPAPQTPKPQ
ncbi:MAG: hypothetical protein ACK4NR_06320 [Micavibrio sp.]